MKCHGLRQQLIDQASRHRHAGDVPEAGHSIDHLQSGHLQFAAAAGIGKGDNGNRLNVRKRRRGAGYDIAFITDGATSNKDGLVEGNSAGELEHASLELGDADGRVSDDANGIGLAVHQNDSWGVQRVLTEPGAHQFPGVFDGSGRRRGKFLPWLMEHRLHGVDFSFYRAAVPEFSQKVIRPQRKLTGRIRQKHAFAVDCGVRHKRLGKRVYAERGNQMRTRNSDEMLAEMAGKGQATFDVQVSECNRTVWVNASDGSCVGRFSKTFGIDVHRSGSDMTDGAGECLFCTHEKSGQEAWDRFRAEMLLHHGVALEKDLLAWE